ncbi:hypothetical protein Lfu02_49980 [Longispora fulva]|nr:hypothetical protein Lfu02_49980 [Longispora fulva]
MSADGDRFGPGRAGRIAGDNAGHVAGRIAGPSSNPPPLALEGIAVHIDLDGGEQLAA